MKEESRPNPKPPKKTKTQKQKLPKTQIEQRQNTTIYNIQNCYVTPTPQIPHFYPGHYQPQIQDYRPSMSQMPGLSETFQNFAREPFQEDFQDFQPFGHNGYGQAASIQYRDRSMKTEFNPLGVFGFDNLYQSNIQPQQPNPTNLGNMFDQRRSPILRQGESDDNEFSILKTQRDEADDPFKFRRSPPSQINREYEAPNLQQLHQVMGANPIPTHILTRGYNDEIISRELPKVKQKKGKKHEISDQHQFQNPLLNKRQKKLKMKLPLPEPQAPQQPPPVVYVVYQQPPVQIQKKQRRQKSGSKSQIKPMQGPWSLNQIQAHSPGSTFEINEQRQRYQLETQQIKETKESEWKVRKIGKLTLEERYQKIQNYVAKREKRQFERKISYDCRKQVADKRLRIKGRFIRKDDQKELMKQILGNDQVVPQDVNQFNNSLKKIIDQYANKK